MLNVTVTGPEFRFNSRLYAGGDYSPFTSWSLDCTYSKAMETNTVQKFCAFILVFFVAGSLFAQVKKLNPTIYFIKSIDMQKQDCSSKRAIHSTTGKAMLKVCANDYKTCVIEGTCAIKHNGDVTIINYVNEVAGTYRFTAVDKDTCPYGYGVKNIC